MTDTEPNSVVRGSGLVDHDNPWPGLIPYTEADQSFFFGRSQEIESLLVRVKRKRAAVLFAASGVGKSSLLEAGLYPRLREENYLPVSIRMDFSTHSAPFNEQLMGQIQRAAKQAGVEAPEPVSGDGVWEYLHRPNSDFWNARNRPQLPVLVFDQFEEFFTLGRRSRDIEQRCAAFLEAIADLAEGSPPESLQQEIDENPELAKSFVFGRHNYKILIALREDYLPDLEVLQERISDIAFNRYRLKRINGHSALEVVDQAPHLIDTAVAKQVVRFVAAVDDPAKPFEEFEIEPALLSVICRELNNRRQRRNLPRITAELLEGSRSEILSDFYERSVGDLSIEARTFIEERLLTVSGFRDSVALENVLQNSELSRDDLRKLEDRRLLRVDARSGHDRVELTHDRLTEVIVRSRDQRRAIEERREAEVRAAEINKRLARSRILVISFAAFSVLTIALAAYAYRAKQESDTARAGLQRAQENLAKLNSSITENEETLSRRIADLEASKEAWETLAEQRETGQDVSTYEAAVVRADAAANESAAQVSEKQRQVNQAQAQYNSSFNVLIQYSGSEPTGSPAQRIESRITSLGFTIDERIGGMSIISENAVIYFDVAAEAPARLIAKALTRPGAEFQARRRSGVGAWSNITIQINNAN